MVTTITAIELAREVKINPDLLFNLVRSEVLVQGATWQKARTLIYVRIAAGVAN